MATIRIQVKTTAKPLSHMELELLKEANNQIRQGVDILFLRLFLEEQLATWKRERIKYRNAPTTIEARGRELFIRHHAADLIQFIPLM